MLHYYLVNRSFTVSPTYTMSVLLTGFGSVNSHVVSAVSD